jgi:hypothetical protein
MFRHESQTSLYRNNVTILIKLLVYNNHFLHVDAVGQLKRLNASVPFHLLCIIYFYVMFYGFTGGR